MVNFIHNVREVNAMNKWTRAAIPAHSNEKPVHCSKRAAPAHRNEAVACAQQQKPIAAKNKFKLKKKIIE